ncbi:MAG: lytic murein transglycosylase B [Steroidobacteraceae bacterium]
MKTIATVMIRWLACASALLGTGGPVAALDGDREDVRQFTQEMLRKHDFDEAWLTGVMTAAQSQPRIIELISRPAEQVMPWHRYRDHFLTNQRIAAGVAFWTTHRARLAEIERSTGVAQHVIVGILGVETFFGRITGRYRVLDALATLAFDYPPRSRYFRDELEQFLLLARDDQVDVATALGSYAGAMGSPQFMPRSYRAYAVDGDGDSRRDLWGNWDDVIASVANYLAKHGWRAGEPVAAPATLWFPGVVSLAAGSMAPDTTIKALRDRGLSFETSLDGRAPALFISVAGDDGQELRAGFHNFGVITRYNRSVMYALAVHDLGRRVESLLPAAP